MFIIGLIIFLFIFLVRLLPISVRHLTYTTQSFIKTVLKDKNITRGILVRDSVLKPFVNSTSIMKTFFSLPLESPAKPGPSPFSEYSKHYCYYLSSTVVTRLLLNIINTIEPSAFFCSLKKETKGKDKFINLPPLCYFLTASGVLCVCPILLRVTNSILS